MTAGRASGRPRTPGSPAAWWAAFMLGAAIATVPVLVALGLRMSGEPRPAEPAFAPAAIAPETPRITVTDSTVRVQAARALGEDAAAGIGRPAGWRARVSVDVLQRPAGWRIITSEAGAPVRLIFAAPDAADGTLACALITADRVTGTAVVPAAPLPPGCPDAAPDAAGRVEVEVGDMVWAFTLVSRPADHDRYRPVLAALAASVAAAP